MKTLTLLVTVRVTVLVLLLVTMAAAPAQAISIYFVEQDAGPGGTRIQEIQSGAGLLTFDMYLDQLGTDTTPESSDALMIGYGITFNVPVGVTPLSFGRDPILGGFWFPTSGAGCASSFYSPGVVPPEGGGCFHMSNIGAVPGTTTHYVGRLSFDLGVVEQDGSFRTTNAGGTHNSAVLLRPPRNPLARFHDRDLLLVRGAPGPIPEPSSWGLLAAGSGLVGLSLWRQRSRLTRT